MTEDQARTTVTDRALARIKEMIASGELEPGQRLPVEKDLAEALGLSRSSMREAIRALTVLGILEARHGAGVYVTKLGPSDLLEAFGVVAEISQGATLLDLVRVRKILEPAAVATAAARITEVDLARLREEMAAMARVDTAEEFIGHDLTFHRIINEAAGNPVLTAILGGLSSRTLRTRVWRGRREEGAIPRTLEEHEHIYRALASRDPEDARTAAAVHITSVEEWVRRQVAAEGEH
ncbi:FadR/GntR family transcriptional regulator [Longispora sp. NPDC051575]|uniref:FadR/GntR family transcriptional regulator n=1 Tax=Longispora sp. NPDC051575 TaxID=3154943 RepID=UPI00344199EC